MASSRPTVPPSRQLDLDLVIVSAKHLKNVNWKNGDLKPYVVFWVDPDRRLATKSDDSGSIKPVWNERFTLPLTRPLHDSFLTLEVFHSRPSDTPKPLVGTLRVPLSDLEDLDDSTRIRKFTITRPSGRPQGTIVLKLGLLGRSFTQNPPPPSASYSSFSSVPPSPMALRDYRSYPPSSAPPPYSYGLYSDSYSGYYSGYYPGAPVSVTPGAPSPRSFSDRPGSYGASAGPSAPVDYSVYETKSRSGRMNFGGPTTMAVSGVAGALGAMALEEGLKYEEKPAEKVAESVDENTSATYRGDW